MLFILPLLMPVAPMLEDIPALDQRIAEVASFEARPLDRRLRLARCPEGAAINEAAGAITVRCASLGWSLRVNAAISANRAASPPAIRRGETVQVMIVGESYTISHEAVATEDAATGAPVRVKFASSAKTMVATAIAPGKARMVD
jgi:flagellar basal body P-ring formation protein FlgA